MTDKRRKLTELEVKDIVRYYTAGVPVRKLAEAYCVSKETIYNNLWKRGVSRHDVSPTVLVIRESDTGYGLINIHSSLLVRERQQQENRKAYWEYRNALRRGTLKRQPCEVCGRTAEDGVQIDGHHDDYNKPLDVRWLCQPHHAEWHAQHEPIGRTTKRSSKRQFESKEGA